MTENQKQAAANRARNQKIIQREAEIAKWVENQPKRPIDPAVDSTSMYPTLTKP